MKLEYRRPIYTLLANLLFFALLSISTLLAVLSNLSPSILKPIGTCDGCFMPIENLNSAHVLEMAKYAVNEHNKRSKSDLEFASVISGESQIVAGMNYKLVISAKLEGGWKNKYEAVVWDQPWTKFRQLTSFVEIKG